MIIIFYKLLIKVYKKQINNKTSRKINYKMEMLLDTEMYFIKHSRVLN